jgi:hypothetical protein
VYAQQLKQRRSRVECPQCGKRFNATAGLLEEAIPGADTPSKKARRSTRRPAAVGAPAPVLTYDEPGRRGGRRSGVWAIAVLISILGLIAQVAWWESDEWMRRPELRAAAERVCARVGCTLPLPRFPGTVDIMQPAMGPHPGEPGGLRLSLVLINRASVGQRPPRLQLELFDEKGKLAAARRFTPDQFLSEGDRAGLLPSVAVHASLDLSMPEVPPAGFRVRLF